MAESIESFVAKLQTDGVEAGQKAADELRAKAQQEADHIVESAKAEAEKIVSNAKTEAENLLSRSKTDLQLAARDAVARLRDTLGQVMTDILSEAVKEPLKDEQLLKELIHELAMKYAQSDIEHSGSIMFNLSPEMHKKLAQFVIDEIHEAAMGHGVSIDLKNRLRQAGFEYSVNGGTIEITEDSVIETLSNFVNPMLGEMFKKALSDKDK